MRALLEGFVADLAGNESHLIEAEPVFSRGGRAFVGSGRGWTWASATPITTHDRSYVVSIDTPLETEIAEGDSVWLAGRNFFSDVMRSMDGTDSAFALGKWAVHPRRGYRWTFGSPRRFDEFALALGHTAQGCLTTGLVREGPDAPGTQSALRVYSVIDGIDPRDRAAHLGLYFLEAGDTYSLDFTWEEARAARAFLTRTGYRKRIERLRKDVLETTLHDEFKESLSSQHLVSTYFGRLVAARLAHDVEASQATLRVIYHQTRLLDDFNANRRLSRQQIELEQ